MSNDVISLPQDARTRARTLFRQGKRPGDIARELGVPGATVRSWKRREGWEAATTGQRMEQTALERYCALVAQEKKSNADYKEIDALGREMERAARIRRFEEGGTQADLNPKLKNRNAGPKTKPVRNLITEDQAEALRDAFHKSLFAYQRHWLAAGAEHRTRFILKSRQIGATWYFAREAFVDALDTGRNQIFLSASKDQARQFRSYIVDFAAEHEVKLEGDPIKLPNGAELRFVSTNASTAQGYHGNLYVDEVFWIPRFAQVRKAASGMASQKQWRTTYFSTPSALTHEAYPFWTGQQFNRGRPKDQQVELDVSWQALKGGVLCPDGLWRQIVTIEDAERAGCTLFDVERLKLEYGPLEYAQLFRCEFIDEENSVFPFHLLESCLVDAGHTWEDVAPRASRPFGHRPVWLGYDPARSGDYAGLVVVAPPVTPKGPFRILEKHQWRGMDFAAQARAIQGLTRKYHVDYIGIDQTGIGAGVFEMVKQFFPRVRGISYSPEVKNRLVLKAYDVIASGRLQFDFAHRDIALAFLAIRQSATSSGRTTYSAGRSEDLSHADLAWATMHALANEPLEGQAEGPRAAFLEFC